jgi:hypothetical protein
MLRSRLPAWSGAAEIVYNPQLKRVIPYLLLISVIGVFCLTGLRKLMIIDWRVRGWSRL